MKENKTTRTLYVISRWIVGLVFLFSSFVKGVDPMGTAYKIQDYMTAWSLGSLTFEWALPMALPLALCLVTAEFLVGVLLLTGAWRKVSAWLLLLMMAFFTVTTFVDALTNKVTDCGCFGDAIKLTNWQTFWKNIILDVPTVVIFLCRRWPRRGQFERESLVALVAIAAMVIFGLWNVKNEPCIDFRPWKVGNRMIPFDENMEVQSFVTYRNTATGATEEFPSGELMQRLADTSWARLWEFADSRVVDPYEIKADGFCMLGPDGEDYAKDIIGNSNYVLIATVHDLNKIDAAGVRALRASHTMCVEKRVNMVMLASALDEEVQAFLHDNNLDELIYYTADATAIKTMLRSNPGFVLMRDAVVMGKWSVANVGKVLEYPFEIE